MVSDKSLVIHSTDWDVTRRSWVINGFNKGTKAKYIVNNPNEAIIVVTRPTKLFGIHSSGSAVKRIGKAVSSMEGGLITEVHRCNNMLTPAAA